MSARRGRSTWNSAELEFRRSTSCRAHVTRSRALPTTLWAFPALRAEGGNRGPSERRWHQGACRHERCQLRVQPANASRIDHEVSRSEHGIAKLRQDGLVTGSVRFHQVIAVVQDCVAGWRACRTRRSLASLARCAVHARRIVTPDPSSRIHGRRQRVGAEPARSQNPGRTCSAVRVRVHRPSEISVVRRALYAGPAYTCCRYARHSAQPSTYTATGV
jgi:hypothetical protein